MAAARARYEVRVRTVVNEAVFSTLRIPMRRTAVPRNSVYRFRVPADCDLSEVLHRLTERDVQVLDIRQCPEPRRRDPGTPQVRDEAPQPDVAATVGGVVVPFRARARSRAVSSAD
jgi:hypothetical protein